MKNIVVAYHSGYGHTKNVAIAIQKGAGGSIVDVDKIDNAEWDILDNADAIIFGCPTYMAGPSAQFKNFIDLTSKRWMSRTWVNKIAGGFTNSGSLSGDKLSTLQQIWLFCMQHGMIWVGVSDVPASYSSKNSDLESRINRLGSSSGLMTQSANLPPSESVPPSGDIETALRFGERIRLITERLKS